MKDQKDINKDVSRNGTPLEFMEMHNPTIVQLPISTDCLAFNGINITPKDLAQVRLKGDAIILTIKGLEITLTFSFEFNKVRAIEMMENA